VDEEDKSRGIKADDDFDESKYVKANPLYDYNPILRSALQRFAIEAKAMPGKLSEFRTKRLNRRSAAAASWIDLRKWNKCGRKVDLREMEQHPCWAALDVASVTDMAAFTLVWRISEDEWATAARYWVPADAAKVRTQRHSAPYQAWINGKHIQATDGDVIDQDVIVQCILDDCARFRPTKVAFDPWNAQQMVQKLMSDGVEMEAFIQGPKSYHPAMQSLEAAYLKGRLRHGNNPVLTWNMANIVPRYDVNLNMAPDRKKSADKIDGAVALLMAFGIAIKDVEDDSAGFFARPVAA
jgi:phage terminase large subunit-like protein